ncbi:MAG: hypothetical protein Q4E13_06140 [Clostridia bacterium]|nr:hypothetical protein [Clostridia bacterium]
MPQSLRLFSFSAMRIGEVPRTPLAWNFVYRRIAPSSGLLYHIFICFVLNFGDKMKNNARGWAAKFTD